MGLNRLVNRLLHGDLRGFNAARRALLARTLGVFYLAGLLALGVGGASARAEAPETRSSVELLGITFVSTQRDARDLIVRASRATLDPEEDVVVLEDMHVEAIPNGGDVRLSLRCKRGKLELATGDFYATGEVRGKTSDGRRIETDRARYDDETGVVSTDAPVLLIDRDGVLRGGGFRYNVVDGALKLTGGAQLLQGADEGEGR